jgi:hypothetical protein
LLVDAPLCAMTVLASLHATLPAARYTPPPMPWPLLPPSSPSPPRASLWVIVLPMTVRELTPNYVLPSL